MLDSFTRYLAAVPIPNQEAKTVAQALVDGWITVHGVPQALYSNRGTKYTGKLWSEMMELMASGILLHHPTLQKETGWNDSIVLWVPYCGPTKWVIEPTAH